MKLRFLSFILLVAGLSTSPAESPIGLSVEFISVDAQTAFDLAAEDHQQPARKALAPMLVDGNAKIEELAYILTRQGTQATLTSCIEITYPTEYDPAETVQKLEGPITVRDQLRTPATPTAFTTRNVGLEIEATLKDTSNPEEVEVNLSISQAVHVGDDRQGQFESELTWPRFHSKLVHGTHRLTYDTDTLVGLLETNAPHAQRRLLAFVKASKRPLPEPPSDESAKLAYLGILTEAIQIPEASIPALLSGDPSAARESVTTLIDAGTASILEASLTVSKSGQHGLVRSGMERIYPVEFDPPELQQTVAGPIDDGVRLATPAHGTTFERRQEGFWLEGNGTLRPDALVALSLRPRKTTLLGQRTCGQGLSEVKLPIFANQSLATDLSLIDGQHALIGLHSDRALDGSNLHTYTMIFVRAQSRQP